MCSRNLILKLAHIYYGREYIFGAPTANETTPSQ